MRKVVAVVAAFGAVVVAAGCGSSPDPEQCKKDLKAQVQVYVDGGDAESGEAKVPDSCKGLSDEEQKRIANEVAGEMMSDLLGG